MYQEIIDIYTAQLEKLATPAQQFARLALNNGDKLYALQLEIGQSYIDFGVEQLKALIEVKDPDSFRAYVLNQVDVAKNVGEKLIADAQAVAELGSRFNADTQKLVNESLNTVVAQAA